MSWLWTRVTEKGVVLVTYGWTHLPSGASWKWEGHEVQRVEEEQVRQLAVAGQATQRREVESK